MSRGLGGVALLLLAGALEPVLQRLGNTLGLIGLAALVVFAAFPGEEGLAEATGAADAIADAAEEQEVEGEDEQEEEGSRLLPGGRSDGAETMAAPGTRSGTEEGAAARHLSEGKDRRLTHCWWQDVDFWLVTPILFINFGCGLELVNNLGQITPALGILTSSSSSTHPHPHPHLILISSSPHPHLILSQLYLTRLQRQ